MEYTPGSVADIVSRSASKNRKRLKKVSKKGIEVPTEIFCSEGQVLQNNKKKARKRKQIKILNPREPSLNVAYVGDNKEKCVQDFHAMPKTSNQSKKRKISKLTVGGSSGVHLNVPPNEENRRKGTVNEKLQAGKMGPPGQSSDVAQPKSKRKREQKLIVKKRCEEEESRTLFIKNLPYTMSHKEIKRIFEKYGPVETVRLRCAPLAEIGTFRKKAVIKREFHPERTNICAFVRFKSYDSVENALHENGSLIGTHHIIVDRSLKQDVHDQRKAVFLGNVPYVVEEDDLWKMFESCGEIADIRIIRDWKTGIGKGFAYVNFKNSDAVELALTLDGEKLKDREIRVKRAVKKQKVENKIISQKIKSKVQNNKFQKKRNFEINKLGLKQELREEKEFPQESTLPVALKEDSNFQGQKFLGIKKKKKKISKDELKKKLIIRQLGLEKKKIKPRKRIKASEKSVL